MRFLYILYRIVAYKSKKILEFFPTSARIELKKFLEG